MVHGRQQATGTAPYRNNFQLLLIISAMLIPKELGNALLPRQDMHSFTQGRLLLVPHQDQTSKISGYLPAYDARCDGSLATGNQSACLATEQSICVRSGAQPVLVLPVVKCLAPCHLLAAAPLRATPP